MISEKNSYFFNEVRDETDVDLTFSINVLIKDKIGIPSSERFLDDSSIVNIKDKKPNVQRVIINKYFLEKLLNFRSNNEIDVSDMLMLLSNDGDVTDWFRLIDQHIIPFCVINDVL